VTQSAHITGSVSDINRAERSRETGSAGVYTSIRVSGADRSRRVPTKSIRPTEPLRTRLRCDVDETTSRRAHSLANSGLETVNRRTKRSQSGSPTWRPNAVCNSATMRGISTSRSTNGLQQSRPMNVDQITLRSPGGLRVIGGNSLR
jgi:hypothetical protein